MIAGLSQVLQRLVDARELERGKCDADLGSCRHPSCLQVICPACRGPLHKRGALGGTVQYLAHARDKEADCEYRVRRIIREVMGEQAHYVRLPPIDRLADFFDRFEEIMVDHLPIDRPDERVMADIDMMCRRSALADFIGANRPGIRDITLLYLTMPGVAGTQQATWIEHAIRYMTRSNTEPLMRFAVCYDAIVRIFDNERDASIPYAKKYDLWLHAMMCHPNAQLQQFIEGNDRKLVQYRIAIAVTNVATRFVDCVQQIHH